MQLLHIGTLVTGREAYLHIQRSLLLCKERQIFGNALSNFGLNKLLKRMRLRIYPVSYKSRTVCFYMIL